MKKENFWLGILTAAVSILYVGHYHGRDAAAPVDITVEARTEPAPAAGPRESEFLDGPAEEVLTRGLRPARR